MHRTRSESWSQESAALPGAVDVAGRSCAESLDNQSRAVVIKAHRCVGAGFCQAWIGQAREAAVLGLIVVLRTLLPRAATLAGRWRGLCALVLAPTRRFGRDSAVSCVRYHSAPPLLIQRMWWRSDG